MIFNRPKGELLKRFEKNINDRMSIFLQWINFFISDLAMPVGEKEKNTSKLTGEGMDLKMKEY